MNKFNTMLYYQILEWIFKLNKKFQPLIIWTEKRGAGLTENLEKVISILLLLNSVTP